MKPGKKHTQWLMALGMLIATISTGCCQETVFGLFSNDIVLGDKYFEKKNYVQALQRYQNAARRHRTATESDLRIARCYYSLKQPKRSIYHYDRYMKVKQTLPWNDLYWYAEAQASTRNYDKAIEYYKKYLGKDPHDETVLNKIWRLSNINFLFEDSAQVAVHPLALNTPFGELCAARYKNGLVFISNRQEAKVVEKINASLSSPYYKVYYSPLTSDTSHSGSAKAFAFDKTFSSRFNAGPVSFYDNGNKMIFVSTSDQPSADGRRSLQLFFAELENNGWKETTSFPYNSIQYSVSDPSISNDGKVLYFSSDMDGGMGGRDLYRSEFVNGRWTRPTNLGKTINTPKDEVFPYFHLNHILYFSSDGHPGMGGLDIFKSLVLTDDYDEPQNVGYPINTNHDDFGIVVDSLDQHGYFSSNRGGGGFDDDIYAFDWDLQTFPLNVAGLIKYKETSWSDAAELTRMPNAKIALVDIVRNVVVYETVSDSTGHFSMVIPSLSRYKVKVTSGDNDESVVVIEIPRRKKELSEFEIVVVKDIFNENENVGNETDR